MEKIHQTASTKRKQKTKFGGLIIRNQRRVELNMFMRTIESDLNGICITKS